jgi:hypothetical protein
MERSKIKRRVWRFVGAVLVGLALLQISCGTIIYPERRGQKSGKLDPAVILLDGACLLIFVIPGIIAFAVDFATGAIYLPPEQSSEKQFYEVHVPPDQLTAQRIEDIVRQHTGKTVSLEPGGYQAMPLENLEEFTPQRVAQIEAGSY